MGLAQVRFASRLARREARRRPGRTLLVVFLIAAPVFGMTVGSVLVRTADAGGDWVTHWWLPGTDIVVEQPFDEAVAPSATILRDLPVEQFADGVLDRVTLIDLPADASAADIAGAGQGLVEVVEGPLDDPRLDPRVSWRGQDGTADSHNGALAWGWVAGAIALAATGIIVSAAFATSARRQLVTVGQLPPTVRRSGWLVDRWRCRAVGPGSSARCSASPRPSSPSCWPGRRSRRSTRPCSRHTASCRSTSS